PGNEFCVRDCYHKGRPLILADPQSGTLYHIQNQDAALPHAGKLIAARTLMAQDGRSLSIERVHELTLDDADNFDAVLAELSRDSPDAHHHASAAPDETAKPSGSLRITTHPGNIQIYVDDEFKGVTSDDGKLTVTSLHSGDHDVRFNQLGHKEQHKKV